ncbi:Blue copper protein [Apostasia shenzhenica]|uniref:Blue copper protein n=1 Tax=Apostasia shenzhenica TaxID=1088818 RepID=A0A2I0A3E1_9ASPA|nr:Blue copper protein [Apostasia shenzhenica]
MALAAALLIIHLAERSAAKIYTVGDASGWTSGVDYSSWTTGKTFLVGDGIAFNYAPGAHTVNEVKAKDYKACSASSYLTTDTSGSTTITFKKAGKHYFICGVSGHCAAGMKLAVTVSSSSSSAPSPSPSSHSPSSSPISSKAPSGNHAGAAATTTSPSSAATTSAFPRAAGSSVRTPLPSTALVGLLIAVALL